MTITTKQYKISDDLHLAKSSLDLLSSWLRDNGWSNVLCTVTRSHRFGKHGHRLPLVDFTTKAEVDPSVQPECYIETATKSYPVSPAKFRRLLLQAAQQYQYLGESTRVDSTWLKAGANGGASGSVLVQCSDKGMYVTAKADVKTHTALSEYCTTALTPGKIWLRLNLTQLEYIDENEDDEDYENYGDDGGSPV